MSIINIFISLILLPLIYFILKYIQNFRRIAKLVAKVPGPPGLPIIGNTLDILQPPEELWQTMRKLSKEYYPIYKQWIADYPVVHLRHPDDAEVLLSSHKNITKSVVYIYLLPWFGTGLLTSAGQKWQHRRKILTPAFHFNILKEFTDVFDEEGRRIVKELNSKNDDITVDLISFIPKYTLNAICETAMGTSLAKMENTNNNFHSVYRKAVHDLGNIIIKRLQRPWMRWNFMFYLFSEGRYHDKCLEIIRSFSKKIIGERKKFHEETKNFHLNEVNKMNSYDEGIYFKASKKKLAMLDLLIAAMKNGHIDDEGIWEEVDTFMFEGHDTTGMGICFTLLLLAEHKDIQQKAREEVDKVLNRTNGHFGISELQQLPYLERCIKEALRLYPSVPLISRVITEDLQLKNYLLPSDVTTHLHIYDLHRDPNFWPDPLRYDPDRFLPENIQGRHPFSYIPFSGGPRNCIGQKFGMLELKAMIGHLLHNFYFEPVDLAAQVKIIPDLVLRPMHGARMKFVPRHFECTRL